MSQFSSHFWPTAETGGRGKFISPVKSCHFRSLLSMRRRDFYFSSHFRSNPLTFTNSVVFDESGRVEDFFPLWGYLRRRFLLTPAFSIKGEGESKDLAGRYSGGDCLVQNMIGVGNRGWKGASVSKLGCSKRPKDGIATDGSGEDSSCNATIKVSGFLYW